MSTSESEQSSKLAAFGPNEWLVDEIYQQYLTDPSGVDPAWWDFFADYVPTEHAGADLVAAAAAVRAAHRAEVEAAEVAADAEIATHTAPQALQHVVPPAAPTAPVPPVAPAAVPVVAAPPVVTEKVEPTVLRGAAARTVSNMEESLTVPVATSVRAVPVKLLIDNRIVINNHLARARGGKVSFTHLIGWALVQALRSMPEMNYGFTEVDGKPAVLQQRARQPRHRDRPGQARRHAASCSCPTSRTPTRWTSPPSGRRTRRSCARRAAASSWSTTSWAPR